MSATPVPVMSLPQLRENVFEYAVERHRGLSRIAVSAQHPGPGFVRCYRRAAVQVS